MVKVTHPVIIINLKTYDTVDGEKAVKLAKLCKQVSQQTKVSIVVAVDALDIKSVAKSVDIPVYSQHIDPVDFGAHTGWIVPESLAKAGVIGTLLNHAEHQLTVKEIKERLAYCKKFKLTSCVCASSPAKVKQLLALQPDYIAYEPPALIGGDISVSTAKPDVIAKVVSLAKGTKTKILCGAGVKTAQDVKISLKLGTVGVLLASGVTKAADPKKALMELASGAKK